MVAKSPTKAADGEHNRCRDKNLLETITEQKTQTQKRQYTDEQRKNRALDGAGNRNRGAQRIQPRPRSRTDILFDHESASTRPTTDGKERATATMMVAEVDPVQLKMKFEIENAGSLKDWRSADRLEAGNDL